MKSFSEILDERNFLLFPSSIDDDSYRIEQFEQFEKINKQMNE